MPSFSEGSKQKLETCHPKLQALFNEVIRHYDCTILCGTRGKHEQEEAFRAGNSKVHFPKSKHNSYPSMAVDVVPFPINWDDPRRFFYFGGFVKGIALSMGIKIRWGGDFNMDNNFHNDRFLDLPHFELLED